MSRVCQVTGKKPSTGYSVSHSHVRTKRWWVPNVHKRRFWLPSERRWVTLNDKSSWRKAEFVDGEIAVSIFHVR